MDWRNLGSGMAAGALSTLALHPVDVVKVRLQTDTKSDYRSRSFMYTFKMLRQMRLSSGIASWYQGLSANLVGSMTSWGMYFMLYERFKKISGGDQYFLASAAAGITTQLVTNPVWMAKTKLCLQLPNQKTNYAGLADCLQSVYKKEGIRGLYRGLIPGLFGVSHGAIQFSVYERLKTTLKPSFGDHNVAYYLMCSSISKVIAVATTYPYQVVRSRVQAGQSTVSSVILSFFRDEGIAGAFKGLGPSILRVLPATCITFVTYETLSKV